MENVFEQLLTLTNAAFCLVIVVLVKLQRIVVERYLWKKATTSKGWNDVFLPLAPMGVGAMMGALITQYPYPEDFKTFWARVFFGVLCGMVSGTIVRIAMKMWPENKVLKMLIK
jgi:hypothetical protein